MIGRLRGTLVGKRAPSLVIDVHGVGYELEAPMSTFYQLSGTGAEVTLHTHLVVREDAHTLYGFATEQERALFRSLIKVTGVGAKMALTILSGVSVEEFTRCVTDGDATALTRMPGIGKKTAERLVVEMRDRLTREPAGGPAVGGGGIPARPAEDAIGDAVSALIALGYKAQEASRMVRAVDTAGLESDEVIRRALQSVVKHATSS